jgi:hypothetical protein
MEILNNMKTIITLFFTLAITFSIAQPSNLRINEVMSSNSSTIVSGYGLYADWIEIYNTGSQLVDIGGLYITDDPANLTKYQFPSGLSLEVGAGSFILIWADDSANGEHTNFKLSSSGETILLVDANGTTIIDSVSFPALSSDQSWGRSTDGTGNFVSFAPGSASPGATNNPLSSGDLSSYDLLKAYPNPFSDRVYLTGSDLLVKVQSVEIYSADGRLMQTLTSPMDLKQGISTEQFPSGMYLFRLVTNRGIQSLRLIKG